MSGHKQCDNCIYGIVRFGEVECTNRYIVNSMHKPDPFDCEFFDEISDSYMRDIEKVMEDAYEENA